jgi:rod shape-determining protein MreD
MLKNILTKYKVYIYLTILTILAYLPVHIITLPIKPAILVISVFYFSIIPQTRPSLVFLIVLGVFDDLLANSVVGITALNYVLISLIASSNTKALLEQKFNVVWAALLIALSIVNFIEASILTAITDYSVFNIEIIFKILITLLVYPLMHCIYSIKINSFRVVR